MSGSDRYGSLKRAFRYLEDRLPEVRASAQAGLIERALTLIEAGYLFDETTIDEAFSEIRSNGSRWIPHEQVASLATALECTLSERVRLMTAVFPNYLFGQHVATLREQKGWSRADLIRELGQLVPKGTIGGEKISEGWLQQIDEGRKVRILKPVVERLADVLECNLLERFKLLLEAGYGFMTSSPEDLLGEVEPLEFTAYLIKRHRRGGELLKRTYMNDLDTFLGLTAREVLILFEKCLTLLDKNDHDRPSP